MLRDDRLREAWKDFFEDYCKSDIENVALSYPEKCSLDVDFSVIDKVNIDLARLLINHPYKAIFNAEESLKDIDTAIPNKIKLYFRPYNLPDTCRVDISKIRAKHFGKSVVIDGLVEQRTNVMQKVKDAAFECQTCGATLNIEQDGDILTKPLECYEKQGGCGRTSSFKFLPDLSQFIDLQKMQVQENLEGLQGGKQPERIMVYLEDDLVGKARKGDRVIVNGILDWMEMRCGSKRSTTFDKSMVAYSVEIKKTAHADISIIERNEK